MFSQWESNPHGRCHGMPKMQPVRSQKLMREKETVKALSYLLEPNLLALLIFSAVFIFD